MLKRFLSFLLLLSLLILPNQAIYAQDAQPDGPVYVVESGDTYYSIGLKFGVSIDQIAEANPDLNPNYLSIGAEVVIPGLKGVQGRLLTRTIPLGESLRTISIRNRVAENQVVRLNRLTSPSEIFAGSSLIVPQIENDQPPQSRYLLAEHQSLHQLALQHGQNPWTLAALNQVQSPWDLLPGEPVFDQPLEGGEQISLISPVVKQLTVNPLPILQGETTLVKVTTTQPVSLSGSLAGRALNFAQVDENEYVALQGVHAMAESGIYPFTLEGRLQDGTQFSFEQMVILRPLGYIQEKIAGVDPSTIDPTVTKPEDEKVREVISKYNPEKYWDGVFIVPGYDPNWITSTFGNRRSYNGSPFSYFHTGVDYGGGTGLPIKSPAPGVIVLAEPLTVRGFATIIDHGRGVYSGFWHQSEIHVQVGDRIDTGQVIGLVGGTGRVTGPHLHWEVWVNGVQVNPLTWLKTAYP
jgi:murein DD-endopeptidase MepM/ murein hydrolase activator NlpD